MRQLCGVLFWFLICGLPVQGQEDVETQKRLDQFDDQVDVWESLVKRQWKITSPKQTIRAQFLRFDMLKNTVMLRKADGRGGKNVSFPISKLQPNDRRILRDIAKMQDLFPVDMPRLTSLTKVVLNSPMAATDRKVMLQVGMEKVVKKADQQDQNVRERLAGYGQQIDAWQKFNGERIWRSAAGKHETRARFLRFNILKKAVVLKKSDGQEVSVPISKLSTGDQRILHDIATMQDSFSTAMLSLTLQTKSIIHSRKKADENLARIFADPEYTFAVKDGKSFPICWEFVCDRFLESAANAEVNSLPFWTVDTQRALVERQTKYIAAAERVAQTHAQESTYVLKNGRKIVGQMCGIAPPHGEDMPATVLFRVGTDIMSVPWTELSYEERLGLNPSLKYYDFMGLAVFAEVCQQDLKDVVNSKRELINKSANEDLLTITTYIRTNGIFATHPNHFPANTCIGLIFLRSALQKYIEKGGSSGSVFDIFNKNYGARLDSVHANHASLRVLWSEKMYQRSDFYAK